MADTVDVQCQNCGSKWTERLPETPPIESGALYVSFRCRVCEAAAQAMTTAIPTGPVILTDTPADEWSKPVKDEEGDWRSETVGAPVGHYHDALLRDGYIGEGMDRQTAIPAHVALRLLAAEASDRLGLKWEVVVDEFTGRLCVRREEWPAIWFVGHDGKIESEANYGCPDTPDELLAAMWGRFLLEDALREAGQ